MEGTTGTGHAQGDASRTNLAVGLAAATLLTLIILAALDHDGPLWIIQGVLGLATVVVALQAGGRSPANPRAFGALIVGGVLLLLFLGFLVTGS